MPPDPSAHEPRPSESSVRKRLRESAILLSPALLLAGLVASVIYVVYPHLWERSVLLVANYLVTPIGQEAWIPLGHEMFGLSYLYIAALLFLVNVSVVLFFGLGVPVEALVKAIPWIGEKVEAFEYRVRETRAARLGVTAALGVVCAVPIHSGGAIIGSMAGRTLGLPRRNVVVGVLAGIGVRFIGALLVVYGLLQFL